MTASRELFRGGPRVFPLGLGGMPLSITGRPSEEQAVRTIHAALDAGMDLIDTADVYCLDDADMGHNERLIARALRQWKGGRNVLVATKGGLRRPKGEWTRDASHQRMRSACEASLKALGVGTIDLYQLHAPDEKVRFEDTLGALADLRKAGKVRLVGLSNVNGSPANENETTTSESFETNRWYRIRLRVTPHRIGAWIDERQVIDLDSTEVHFAIWVQMDPLRPLGIATWYTGSALKQITIKRLD